VEWLGSPARMHEAGCAARLRYLRRFESKAIGARLTGFLDSIDSRA